MIFKVDIDIKFGKSWMDDFIETRKAVLESLGFTFKKVNKSETKRGWHFWFHCKERCSPNRANEVQYMLGDDKGRVIINAIRIKRGVPWRIGNKLFSKVIWRKKHKCNCELHHHILENMKKGQKILMDDEGLNIRKTNK